MESTLYKTTHSVFKHKANGRKATAWARRDIAKNQGEKGCLRELFNAIQILLHSNEV